MLYLKPLRVGGGGDDAAGRWLLISLDKLLKDRNEFHDKINQIQNAVKDNNELSDKTDSSRCEKTVCF